MKSVKKVKNSFTYFTIFMVEIETRIWTRNSLHGPP